MNKDIKKTVAVPIPSIRRMPAYLSYAKQLLKKGQKYVSSTQIGAYMNIDSTQVTKDLSYTSIVGKTRVGYETEKLIDILTEFLGFNVVDKAFLVGAGSLGSALLHDRGLLHFGLEIIAAFDVDPNVVNTEINGVNVYHLDNFRDLANEKKVAMGILTVPAEYSQTVADLMVAWGIKAIWNFTPARIKVPNDIIVQNTTMYSNLAVIFNKLHGNDKVIK